MWGMICELSEDWPGKIVLSLLTMSLIGVVMLLVVGCQDAIWWNGYRIAHNCQLISSVSKLRNTFITIYNGTIPTIIPIVQSYNENCYKCSDPDTLIVREE